MRLVCPTDFEIVEALSDGKRNTAQNLAGLLEKDRGYINGRLPILADYSLTQRIGPAPNSGVYAITDNGYVALENRKKCRQPDADFDKIAFESDEIQN